MKASAARLHICADLVYDVSRRGIPRRCEKKMESKNHNAPSLKIGWAQADITPAQTVQVCGQFHSRISEGVHDPLTATALVLDGGDDYAVMVSCDIVFISDTLLDAVRANVAKMVKDIDPQKVVLNATHTHTGPEVLLHCPHWPFNDTPKTVGLRAMDVQEYVDMAAKRIADAVQQAWSSRSEGTISFGLDWAVVGHNRRWVDINGNSKMYGNVDTPLFSHIEGYEEHTVGVIATRDMQGRLTGLVVNVPCPSQVSEGEFFVSADYWHETRIELRHRFGEKIYVLPQCSAAGDQAPRPLYEKQAKSRMLELAGRGERQEYALRISNAVQRVLETLDKHIDATLPLKHHVETVQLPLIKITKEHVKAAMDEAAEYQKIFDEEQQKLAADPSLKNQPRWYVPITRARNRVLWLKTVEKRYEEQQKNPSATYPCELHVIRLGDVVFATNPFEYYLDFGIFIKSRSKATQTFLVQLAGFGSYAPSLRSSQGGGYGSIPASNTIGPDGGRKLAERTIECIEQLWA